jgi:UDP-N-acetylglucosamine--N-acetylmuramyl-(pentapeptide) pyrophosphoryl-undecaprenol N-acetylglucosamine transferase
MSAPVLIVMAGGTGGHVFPGLAVADYVRERGWKVVWMGNPDGMEAELVPARGYDMAWVRFAGLRGKGLLRALMLPLNLLRGFWQALRELGRVRPQVVLGMGGYITFPGGMMAVVRGLPLVVHEQNSIAGLANRVLARLADRVLTGFPDVLPEASWTGNPVRPDIAGLPAPAVRYGQRSGPLNLLVVGGSLGAQVLNETVPRALAALPAGARPQVVHQAGARNVAALSAAYEVAGVQAQLLPFVEDMPARYAWADLAICRAGALTVAELAAAGVASILVPYPHAVDDHQTTNARFLSEAGAALLLPQAELSAQRLADLLRGLDREALRAMAERARALAKPEATRMVAEACMNVAGSGDRGGRHREPFLTPGREP